MRAGLLLALIATVACDAKKSRQLDHDLIHVTGDARLRTDIVGDGQFAAQATFVLVDAVNTAGEGAYVTLAGELSDAGGAVLGALRPQSLWIPPGETRTFALIDREGKPRPGAAAAKIYVRGADIPASPPPASVAQLHELVDDGRIVVQAMIHNPVDRPGNIMVIASFHDASGQPMTRPFSLVRVNPNADQAVQFVGPPGSKHGTIFLGDAVY